VIEFTIQEVGVKVDEWCVPPTVYLDHWAWRKISDSEHLAARFSKALTSRCGTLTLSWLNLIEFSKVSDPLQTRRADALLDALLPHVFILNPDFFKVISKEDELIAGGAPIAPHADFDSLRFFAKHNLAKRNSLRLLPAQNLFSLAAASEISSRFDGFADLVVNHIESLRRDYDTNPKFRLAVKRLPKGKPIQCGTRYVARELLGSLLLDKSVQVGRNHAIDVCHAVVPVAYCDFVLLDGHWATQVERARKRIQEGGLSFPMAKVYSERANGIEKFFLELESGRMKASP
jgi:hypothetical protein